MTNNDANRETNGQFEFWKTRPKLEVRVAAGLVDVRVGGLTLSSFKVGDDGPRNVAIVGLLDGGLFTANEVAEAFGLDPSRISQIRKRYREGGAALLLATSPGVRGPRRLNESDIARIRAWRRAGLTIDEITAKVNAERQRASRSTIGDIVVGLEKGHTTDLPLGAECEEAAEDTSPAALTETPPMAAEIEMQPTAADTEPPVLVPELVDDGELLIEERHCSIAGAMVAHAALHALGFQAALDASHAQLKPATLFDLLRTAAVMFFGVLLRYKSVEDMRHLIRGDFGTLIGTDRAPELRTLRRKLAEIGSEESRFDGAAFIRGLAQGLLAAGKPPEDVYFFDDHFKPYFGKRTLAKGWDAKRRIGAPGIEDVYVHDLKGRALLFVPLDAPTSLSRAMPRAIAELRQVSGATPSLAVFDRGGFSRELFRSLVHPTDGSPRIDFLTYLVARKKARELALSDFKKASLDHDGLTLEYEVAESTLDMKGFDKPLRLLVLLDRKKAKQIPILTSDPDSPAAKLVHLLRARWRQENSFKYLVGELAIDSLVSHDMTTAPDDREVDNPERAALREELAEAQEEVAKLDLRIARALAENEEARRPTVRGFKIANADLTYARKYALEKIEALRADIARLPAKVRRQDLAPGAVLAKPKTKRRVFVNGLKLLVHNAEKWLAELMGAGPYAAHALPILRHLFEQPGRVMFERDRVRVEIAPLDTPRYQRAVKVMLDAINKQRPLFLDSRKVIEFSVAPSPGRG